MLGFALRRVLWTIPILLVVVTSIFFLMRGIGGNPLRHGPLVGFGTPAWSKSGDPKPEEITANMKREFGLDLPWYEQYANYLEAVVTLDFGPSIAIHNRSVNEIIVAQAPRTLELGALAFLLAVALGIPLGVVAALKAESAVDYGARFLVTFGVGVPSFFLATVLIWLASLRLGVLPTSGWDESWQHKVLPVLALSLLPMAYCARIVRASMLETLREDYVRSAVAKGLRRPRVVVVHVVRNSLIPVVTAAGPLLGHLLTGSFVIENIFAIPGIGRYYVAAVVARDYPLVMGLTVLLAVVFVLVNLVVDLLYGALDPRIRDARTA